MTDKQADKQTDKRNIDEIISELEKEWAQERKEGFQPMANLIAQYYDALIKASITESLAQQLVLQWHLMMWTMSLSNLNQTGSK